MNTQVTPIPEAPGRFPVIGHGWAMTRNPLDFIQDIRRLGEIVMIYLGPKPVYVLNSPRVIRHMLVTEADGVQRGRLFEKGRVIFGNGLITSDDPFHRQQRRLIQPAMQPGRIAGYVDIMREQVEVMLGPWQDGQLVDIRRPLNDLAFRSVANALFRARVGQDAVDGLMDALQTTLNGLYLRILLPDWVERLPVVNRRYRAAAARVRSIADTVVAAYRAEQTDHRDLLSMLLAARNPETGEGMSPVQVRDEMLSFLIAGSETTAHSLAWLFHEVSCHPLVERRLMDEIDLVLGDRPVTSSDIEKLGFTRQVIHETLRMYPPSWMQMRRTTRPMEFGRMNVPCGAELMLSPFAVQRDPALYLDPSHFNPDRWGPNANPPRDAFLPFGTGQHLCIGNHFAFAQMSVVVATVLRKWRMRPAGGSPVRMVSGSALRPSHLLTRLERRRLY